MVTLCSGHSLPGLLRLQRHRSSEPATALTLSITSLSRTSRREKNPYSAISGRVVNGRPLTPAARWRSLIPAFPSATGQLSLSLNSLQTSQKLHTGQMLRLHFRGLPGAQKALMASPVAVQVDGIVGTQSCTFKRRGRKVSLKPSSTRKLGKRRQRREPSELRGWGQEDVRL
jgi:hypothetical protein